MQSAFVGLPCLVIPALSLLIAVELLYTWVNLRIYFRSKHLKSCLLLIPKVTQSLLLLVLEGIFLWTYIKLEKKAFAITESHQHLITKFIFVSNIVEYLFLVFYIYTIVNSFLEHKRKEKASKLYKKYSEEQSSALVYKTVTKDRDLVDLSVNKPISAVAFSIYEDILLKKSIKKELDSLQ